MTLDLLSKSDWAIMSENVHRYSFGIERKSDMDRITYALVVRKGEELCCYCTIIELDKESVYMQHGGNFKESEGTVMTLRGYLMMMDYLKKAYKTISTRVLNKNHPMMKLAMAADMDPTGLETNDGDVFLVFMWQRLNQAEELCGQQ